jgi:hypothetical protein
MNKDNPRSMAAKSMLAEDTKMKPDIKKDEGKKEENKGSKKEVKKPKSEEMGEVSMRVILPDSPELAALDVGSKVILQGVIVAKSAGKVSADVLGVETGAAKEGVGQLPSLSDINAVLSQAPGGAGVPAGAGITPPPLTA